MRGNHFFCVVHMNGNGFFNEYMQSVLKGVDSGLRMGVMEGRDKDRINSARHNQLVMIIEFFTLEKGDARIIHIAQSGYLDVFNILEEFEVLGSHAAHANDSKANFCHVPSPL